MGHFLGKVKGRGRSAGLDNLAAADKLSGNARIQPNP